MPSAWCLDSFSLREKVAAGRMRVERRMGLHGILPGIGFEATPEELKQFLVGGGVVGALLDVLPDVAVEPVAIGKPLDVRDELIDRLS